MTRRPAAVAETAAMIRRLLDALERGELEEGGERGRLLRDRLEGALAALEEVAQRGAGATKATNRA